jgi:hypothetical protein
MSSRGQTGSKEHVLRRVLAHLGAISKTRDCIAMHVCTLQQLNNVALPCRGADRDDALCAARCNVRAIHVEAAREHLGGVSM